MDVSIDIAGATPLDSVAFERAHLRIYAGFIHILRWFALHAAVDLIGIAGFVTGHPGVGATFIALGTALLVWGILTTRPALRRAAGEGANPPIEATQTVAFPGADVRRAAA